MSLTTGRCLNHNHWTSHPMPQDIIDHIHALTHHQGALAGLTFADHHGLTPAPDDLDPDDDDDSSYTPSENGSDDSSASSDSDNDLNLTADPNDIAGVDNKDKEADDDDDRYVEITGVNENANKIRLQEWMQMHNSQMIITTHRISMTKQPMMMTC